MSMDPAGNIVTITMVSRLPPTPRDLCDDARNALRLAALARSDRQKAMLLKAANEFLNQAAELEAGLPPRGRGAIRSNAALQSSV
jgi:hypothetical protein